MKITQIDFSDINGEIIDESVDISPYINKLASLGRQVFIAVCANYPVEKLKHNAVQIVHTEADDVED